MLFMPQKMDQCLEKLWIKLVSEIPQDMFQSVILQTRLAGRGLHQVLPVVHTLTGCDYTGKFCTKHAALKANPEKYITAIRVHE